jgi:hypothetical protein
MLVRCLKLPHDLEVLGSKVASIRKSRVYLLTERRNAWHNTMINRYSLNTATFTDINTAKKAAEGLRKAGSFFEIDEMWSLDFDLDEISLVITHINASPPLKTWRAPLVTTSRQTPLTGIEVFNILSGQTYREATSGWQTSGEAPDVLVGVIERGSMHRGPFSKSLSLYRSSVTSDGKLSFAISRISRVNSTHLDRVMEELGHRTHQPRRVHEVAKILQISSFQLLQLLSESGASASGPQSWLSADEVETVRERVRAVQRSSRAG